MQTLVIGSGVSGLSTGIRLLEAGHEVTIWARDLPPNTTSNIAAAIWHPFKAYPIDRVVGWGRRTYEVFDELARVPDAGVRFVQASEIYSQPVPDPEWRDVVRDFRRAGPGELPPGYTDGYIFETALIETPIYLSYLVQRFKGLGGKIVRREVGTIAEALAVNPTVVNCTGLGARVLAHDDSLYPIRGQIVRV